MEIMSGNIFIRPNIMPVAGQKCGDHEHNFDHTTIVFTGAIHVIARNRAREVLWERECHAPDHILIKAEVSHEITALVDNTVFWCVYSHRDAQGNVLQESNGRAESYA